MPKAPKRPRLETAGPKMTTVRTIAIGLTAFSLTALTLAANIPPA